MNDMAARKIGNMRNGNSMELDFQRNTIRIRKQKQRPPESLEINKFIGVLGVQMADLQKVVAKVVLLKTRDFGNHKI